MSGAQSWPSVRAVTFDAAGTLIEPRERVGETYARVARRHGIEVDPVLAEHRFFEVYRAAAPLCFPHLTRADDLVDAERQ
ncbi:MAG: hypothetical protein KatS3mg082_3104 [Nitrospiraceae bacterium]|nr:MAG: hypothetical protein KatS3mg082_3104 [Nitrospiraceae bacterium]